MSNVEGRSDRTWIKSSADPSRSEARPGRKAANEKLPTISHNFPKLPPGQAPVRDSNMSPLNLPARSKKPLSSPATDAKISAALIASLKPSQANPLRLQSRTSNPTKPPPIGQNLRPSSSVKSNFGQTKSQPGASNLSGNSSTGRNLRPLPSDKSNSSQPKSQPEASNLSGTSSTGRNLRPFSSGTSNSSQTKSEPGASNFSGTPFTGQNLRPLSSDKSNSSQAKSQLKDSNLSGPSSTDRNLRPFSSGTCNSNQTKSQPGASNFSGTLSNDRNLRPFSSGASNSSQPKSQPEASNLSVTSSTDHNPLSPPSLLECSPSSGLRLTSRGKNSSSSSSRDARQSASIVKSQPGGPCPSIPSLNNRSLASSTKESVNLPNPIPGSQLGNTNSSPTPPSIKNLQSLPKDKTFGFRNTGRKLDASSHSSATWNGRGSDYPSPAGRRKQRNLAKARADYLTSPSGHIRFRKGQVVELLDYSAPIDSPKFSQRKSMDSGETGSTPTLWKGRVIFDGEEIVGLFPCEYVVLMKTATIKPDQGTGTLSRDVSSILSPDNAIAFGANAEETLHEADFASKSVTSDRSKYRNLLFHSLMEMVSSEVRHVEDLSTVLIELFMPFERTFGVKLTRQVFSDWLPLLQTHKELMYTLSSSLTSLKTLSTHLECLSFDPYIQPLLRSSCSDSAMFLNKKANGQEGDDKGQLLVLSEEERDCVCGVIKVLEHVHRKYVAKESLEDQQIETWEKFLYLTSIRICSAIVGLSDWLKLCIPCVVNLPNSTKVLENSKVLAAPPRSCVPDGKKFSQITPGELIGYLEVIRCENLNNLTLQSYLIKPMQRITKYPLMIREILKNLEGLCKFTPGALNVDDEEINDWESSPKDRKLDYLTSEFDDSNLPPLIDLQAKAIRAVKDSSARMSRLADYIDSTVKKGELVDSSERMVELLSMLTPKETVQGLNLLNRAGQFRLHKYGKVFYTVEKAGDAYIGQAHRSLDAEPSSAIKRSQIRDAFGSFNLGSQSSKKQFCHAMLFTPMLLLTHKARNRLKQKKKYQILKVFHIPDIDDMLEEDGCVEIQTKDEILSFYPKHGDSASWLKSLDQCKQDHAQSNTPGNSENTEKGHSLIKLNSTKTLASENSVKSTNSAPVKGSPSAVDARRKKYWALSMALAPN